MRAVPLKRRIDSLFAEKSQKRCIRAGASAASSEVHTTEVVCFWLLRPSAHCLMCRDAGTYSPQGKFHTIPCCQRIQSKERQRERKARQMSRANRPRASPYEQATRQRSIKSDNTHLLRAEHRGTLADNAPKSSEDKRAFKKSNNKRI